MTKRKLANETTFICPKGEISIRLSANTSTEICKAAINLDATHFVAIDGISALRAEPVWGVFSMAQAEKDNPVRGVWSVRDPIKTFEYDQHDAAVMYAITLQGRS